MVCKKCGRQVVDGISFCPHCGAYQKEVSANDFSNNDVLINSTMYTSNDSNDSNKTKKDRRGKLDLFFCLIVLGLWIVAIYLLFTTTRTDYKFEDKSTNIIENNEVTQEVADDGTVGVSKSGYDGVRTSDDVTAIIYDNQYLKYGNLKSKDDVLKMVASDSEKQKTKCPKDILEVENAIIKNYNVTAVNLCEMDVTFANELKNVVGYIYNQFPNARGYLTNLTLANVGNDESYIAAFMPIFTFITSKSNTGYPIGLKTQIILNSKYFLNPSKINSSVNYGSKTGYFPKNATRSSTVAHEFGHYLSYVAMLNYYQTLDMTYVSITNSDLMLNVYKDFNAGDFSYKLLQEAYSDYQEAFHSAESFETFRSSISAYAVAKDDSGKYIYDETIAEAFHDYYLNGKMAKPASLYIINVLRNYL